MASTVGANAHVGKKVMMSLTQVKCWSGANYLLQQQFEGVFYRQLIANYQVHTHIYHNQQAALLHTYSRKNNSRSTKLTLSAVSQSKFFCVTKHFLGAYWAGVEEKYKESGMMGERN